MAKQTIFTGSVSNDGTGDLLRDAFIKVNQNFDELYVENSGAHDRFNVAYGGTNSVQALVDTVFTYNSVPIEVSITVTSEIFPRCEVRLAAPQIILDGVTNGPVIIQRVIGATITNLHAVSVSNIDNNYHVVIEDEHNQEAGVEVTYRLYNGTSVEHGGTIYFPTTYGFQFGCKEV